MALFGLFGSRGTTADATIRVNYNGKQAEKGLGSLKKTISTVVTVAAVTQLAKYTKQLADLGAQSQIVNKNFEKFAKDRGKNTNEMMMQMRKATKGMVSDVELQQKAMQAMISGVDFDDAITAMEFVSNYAIATGTNVNQKLQTVFTGLARESALFFDDVGIQVVGSKDVVNDAIDQMKVKMDDFAESQDDTAVSSAKLQSNLKNLAAEIGKNLTPAYSALLNVANEFIETQLKTEEELELEKKINSLEGAIASTNKRLKEGSSGFEKFMGSLNAFMGGVDITADSNEEMNESLRRMQRELKMAKQALAELKGEATKIDIAPKPKVDPFTKMSKEDQEKRIKEVEAQTLKIAEANAKEADQLLNIESDFYNKIQDMRDTAIQNEKEDYWNIRGIKLEILEQERADEEEHLERMQLQREMYYKNVFQAASAFGSAFSAIGDAVTASEVRNLKKSAKTQEEFDKKMAEIQRDSAIRQQQAAIFFAGIKLVESTAAMFSAIAKSGEAGSTLGVVGAAANMIATGALFAANIAQLESLKTDVPQPTFQQGRLPEPSRGRMADSIAARIGPNEAVIDGPTTERNFEALRQMRAGTFGGAGGGRVINNNFYGVSTETVLQAQVNADRINYNGKRM